MAERDPNAIVRNARRAVAALPDRLFTRSWSFAPDSLAIAVYGPGEDYLGVIEIDHVTAQPRAGSDWYKRDRATLDLVMRAVRGAAKFTEPNDG